MEKCRFCNADLEEGSAVCPSCGRNNEAEQTPEERPEEVIAPEAVSQQTEENNPEAQPEQIPFEPAPEEAPSTEIKKGILVSPGVIAAAAGATFIRVPVFVDTVLFSDGIIYPCAHDCVNYRKRMGLEHIKILADCQVKHSYMLCPSISIEASAKEAAGAGADGIIITGSVIGEETPIEMIARVKKVVKIPVFAGSGVKPANVREQLTIADGCIVGSSFKKDGVLTNPIDYALARELIEAKG